MHILNIKTNKKMYFIFLQLVKKKGRRGLYVKIINGNKWDKTYEIGEIYVLMYYEFL